MTELLEQGIEAVRGLPADRQDLAGHLLLTLAAGEPRLTLTAEQIEDVKPAVEAADRGGFASDADVCGGLQEIRPVKLRYTPRGLRHLDAISDRIGEQNPDAALRIGRRIWETFGGSARNDRRDLGMFRLCRAAQRNSEQ